MVRRRSRASPRGETFGLVRTRIFVSRTTLTVASYDAAEHASGLPEGQLPSLRGSFPEQPGRPCSPGVSLGSRRPGGAGVQGLARRYGQGSARPAYGRRAPGLPARRQPAPTGQSSGSWASSPGQPGCQCTRSRPGMSTSLTGRSSVYHHTPDATRHPLYSIFCLPPTASLPASPPSSAPRTSCRTAPCPRPSELPLAVSPEPA